MDKKTFLNTIMYEDKNALSNIYDKIGLAEKTGKCIFSNEFYTPNLWKPIKMIQKDFHINIYDNGIFEECERKMLAFSKDCPEDFPSVLLRVTNKSHFEKLEHRDYLGAVMALGIKREKIGDLILKNDACYGAFSEDICDYIQYNLTSIGRCPCVVEILDDIESQDIKPNSEEIAVITTALRLDCVVSAITNLSRSKAVDIIGQGKVLLDYSEITEKDKNVDNDSIITIRGYGKFKVIEQIGSTQKGRIRLKLRKYI
jgi:RNA-binding protein YlmH